MTSINESDSASAEQQRSIKSEIWASPVNTCGTVSGNGDEQPASRSYVEESRNSTPSGFELGTLMASARSNEDEDLIALKLLPMQNSAAARPSGSMGGSLRISAASTRSGKLTARSPRSAVARPRASKGSRRLSASSAVARPFASTGSESM